jgi:hypothetical protein
VLTGAPRLSAGGQATGDGARRRPRRWLSILPLRAIAAGFTILVLAACATAPPLPVLAPAELPFHAEESGFPVHWRLERDGAVVAAGVVEVAAPRRYLNIALELRGVDASGKVVSRGGGNALPPGLSPTPLWPFRLELQPTGSEGRFEVKVVGVIPFEVPQGGR